VTWLGLWRGMRGCPKVGQLVAGLIVAVVLVPTCARPDDARVRVIYEAGPGSTQLEHLTVFVGGSKSSWPWVRPGESVSVVLSPGGAPPRLTMNYTLQNTPRTWEGPEIFPRSGYAISIRITPDGRVSSRHCTTPCSQPD
jgi:hypothetical protein